MSRVTLKQALLPVLALCAVGVVGTVGTARAQDAAPARAATVATPGSEGTGPAGAAPAASAAPRPKAPELTPAELEARKQLDASRLARVQAAYQLLGARRPAEAEAQFRALVAEIEAEPRDPGKRYYCASSQTETLAYLLQAATLDKTDAVVVGPPLCEAMYGRAYALVELKRTAEARTAMERLVEMAPMNSQFLIEYGQVLLRSREFEPALALFQRAERHVALMPEGSGKRWEALALRSQGYAWVELGRLDLAEAAYLKSLEAQPGHQGAQAELQFIRGRKNAAPKP